MLYRFISVFRWGILLVLCAGMIFQPQSPAYAAATITITPNSWNIIGLDSNTPASGPFRFPVGAKVCNTSGAATTVTVNFVWDDGGGTFWGDAGADAYINLRSGSLSSVSLAFTGNGCLDAYFEVEVNKVAAAFDKTRRYHITATNTSGSVSTPQPRELYVEHLISQNRNSITNVKLNGTSIAPGGTMTLLVGNTYTIELDGGTATQGYNQFEDFINFPNTIFQMISVSTTYSADSNTSHVPNPNPALYADACTWDNNPGSPTYRSCVGGDDKAGGSNVVTTYTVKILSGAGTTQTLNTLLYDFSGSSYHYNADYGVGARFAYIVGPSSVTMQKSFSPKAIAPAGTSTMTIKLSNPTSVSFTGVHFTDTFPTSMTIANTTTTNTCGGSLTDNSSGTLGVGDVGIALSGGSLSANSTCTITVNVTVPAGTYVNTTGNLFVNVGGTDTDTGNNASDTLTAASAPSCTPGQTLARWTMPVGSSTPPDTTGGVPTTNNTGFTATAFHFPVADQAAVSGSGSPDTTSDDASWETWGYKAAGGYVEFAVDTRNYSGVQMSFMVFTDSSTGPTTLTVTYTGSGSGTAATYTGATLTAGVWNTKTIDLSSLASTTGATTIRITGTGANNDNSGADAYFNDVSFTGCTIPAPAPTIAKTFRNSAGTADVTSIQKSTTSTLRFTLNNNAAGNRALTGVAFTDTLPLGLDVVSSTSAQCGGTLTVTNNISPTRDTISLSGGTLAAAGSCTFDVTVTGTTEGQYNNVTGFVSSTESGTSTNYAEDTLNVIAPPTLSKSFSPSSISTGNTSTLSFRITNPNNFTSLSGIGFTDTLPVGVTATNGTTNNVCGLGSSLVISGGNLLTITGGFVASNGSCSFSTNITGTTSGTKNNTTSVVSSTEGGNGIAASATLVVTDLTPLIGLNKQISTDNTNWFKFVGLIPTQNIWYKFTVSNDGEATLNGINLTDSKYSLATCTPALPASLAVGVSASCVLGPISVTTAPTPNPFINIATVTTTTYTPSTPVTSTAKYGTESLALVKSVAEGSFTSQGNLLHYSYQVTNNGGYPLPGPVTVSDDKASVTCPAVNTVPDNDDYLDPGESLTCTATYTVAAGDVTAGSVTNTASATVSGVTSNTASKTVNRLPDFTVSKTNDVSNSVGQNATFNWTIAVSNISSGSGTFADTQTILGDALPGVAGYYPQGALTVTNGTTAPIGTINCSITGTALSCVASEAVDFPASASFSVTFAVTPTAIGSLTNTATVDPSGNVTELDETNNASTNTVTVVGAPSISKSFSPNPTVANVNSTLTFTITNPNTATALNGVAFSDTYPTGLVNAAPLSTTNSCGGTLTATAGGGTISLSGGTIATNSSCTITVALVAATGGTYVNSTGNVTSTNGGTGNTASSTLSVFDAQPAKSLVTTSEPSTGFSGAERVTIGEMVRYRLISRIPEGSFANVQLLDGIPTGLQFLNDNTATVAFVCNSGAACMTSSTLSGAGLVVNGTSSNVSPTFTVPGAAISGGPFTSGTDVTFSVGNIANLDTDANVDSEYIVVEFNALVLNVNSGVTINQGTDNLAGTDIANNRQNDLTLRVNGSAVGAASPNVTVDIAEPAITAFTKSVSPAAGPYLPGDALTYTLSFSNTTLGNNNAATAFDVLLSDTFDSNLTLGAVNVSGTQGATCAGGTAFTTSNSTVEQLLTVNVSCLDPGKSVTVTVNATIAGATASGTNIANSSSLTYTSLPGTQGNCATAPFTCSGIGTSGSGTGERNGSGGSGADGTVLNNYAFTSNTVSTPVSYGSITIILDSVPNHAQDFSYTGSGPNSYTFGGGFNLDDDADGTLPNTQTFTSLVTGTYTLTQGIMSGWTLTGLTCVDPDSGSTVDLGSATATIDVDAGESVVCTYTNTQWAPSIVLTKTPTLNNAVVAPNTVSNSGDTITYAFSIQNTGNVTITNINVTDPLLPSLSCTIASLAAGATSSCTATNNVYTLTQTDVDAGTRANTATATGKDPGNNDVTDSDSINTPLIQSASIVLTKTPALNDSIVLPAGVVNVGDTLTYTFSVENTGNVTITSISVSDALLPTLSCSIASLAPGVTASCTATNNVYTLTQADIDAGSRANTATATGKDPGNNDVSDPDTKTVTLTQNPALTIVKSVTETSFANVGDVLHYSYLVTNSGNVTLSGPFTVADDKSTDESCPGTATLAPGASITCTATYTITGADITTAAVTNIASAHGFFGGNPVDSATDTKTVNLAPNPVIVLTKTPVLDDTVVAPGGVVNAGDTIVYTFSVQNAGNVTITSVVVTDPLLPTLSCTIASLAPGATSSCTATNNVYTLTQADIDTGSRVNSATATGKDPGNNDVTDSDTKTVPLAQTPSIVLTKTATLNDAVVAPSGVVNAGDTITYTFSVQNTGNVTIININVTDPLLPTLSCTIASLVPGATSGCTATNNIYTLTQADIDAGSRSNTATATGKDPGNNDVSDPDTRTTTLPQLPSMVLTKTPTLDDSVVAPGGTVNVGDTITYTFSVQNTGNVTITNINVADPLLPTLSCAIASLAPGANVSCTPANNVYTLTQADINAGSRANTATATGKDPNNNDVNDPDTKMVTLTQSAALTIAKSATETSYSSVGDVLHYSYIVTNSGNVTLDGPFTVTDDQSTDESCPATATLAPGANITCNATYTVAQADLDSGSVTNIASAHGSFGGNPVDSATDTVIVNATQTPALSIVKSVTETFYAAVGDVLHYSYIVTNSGNVTLDGPFTVTDNKSTDESCPATATLNASASITCSATYTVTQADLNAGSVTNIASAHGSFGGNPIDSATDTVSVNAAQTSALSIVKSVTETSYANGGDVLHYSYLVTNTGNVTLDGPFTITDDKSTDETCPATATLAPGASLTCTATYTIGPGDMSSGSVTNIASAHGFFSGNAIDSLTDTKTVNLAAAPAIALTKTPALDDTVVAPNGVVNAGDTITYTFSVENTGNVTVTNINIVDPLLLTLICNIASLNSGATASCTPSNNVYTLTQADVDAGSRTNTATATGKDPGNNDVQDSDTKTTALGKAPALTIVKEVSTDNSTWNDTSVSVSVGDTVYYRVRVSNTGNTTLAGLTVDDGMASCTLVRRTDITGNNDNTFEAGEEWAYTCSVTAVLGTNNNTATADTTETSSVSDSAIYVAGAAAVADPALSKSADPTQASVGDPVTFTLTVTNKGTVPAPNVVVTDVLPSIFDVTAVNISGAPLGTVVNVTPLIGTGPAPYTVVVTLGGDLTATDIVTIQIVTKVNSAGNPPINNNASLTTSALTDIVSNDSASVAINIRRSARRLPATGFAKDVKTILGPQPFDLKFAATDVMLEIPSLGVKIPIVGVPQKDGTWNISWLENQAGWLQGTAFPSWSGNSVLTGHVYMASGLPGPFVNLSKSKYGDKIIVHAYGQKYTFAVQTNAIVSPDDQSVMKHEEKSWLTLVTCKDYDEKTRTYLARVVVRAVLVRVDWE